MKVILKKAEEVGQKGECARFLFRSVSCWVASNVACLYGCFWWALWFLHAASPLLDIDPQICLDAHCALLFTDIPPSL